jgi:hypothetical protein
VARYDKHGGKIATTIFEAAAWHKAVQPMCSGCPHSAIFHPHALWWYFRKRGWNDNLRKARAKFWCRKCGERVGKRIRPRVLELVPETDDMIRLQMPSEAEWKKAVNRFRS